MTAYLAVVGTVAWVLWAALTLVPYALAGMYVRTWVVRWYMRMRAAVATVAVVCTVILAAQVVVLMALEATA